MDTQSIAQAILLGIVEGLTEFLPVSSTAHLIMLVDLLGFAGPPGKVFEVVIQLGAILAVCVVFWRKLWDTAAGLPRGDRTAWHFALTLLVAVLPALVIGALAHGFIKRVLFSPWVVCATLIAGGVAILVIERTAPKPKVADVDALSYRTALAIGLCQCVAMIPGVSRSGAIIMGGLLLGVERRTATQFAFFLAIPTMVAATAYDLYKNWAALDGAGLEIIAIGFGTAFLASLVVAKALIGFVGRHGFAPFAWYRIAIGLAMLAVLLARG